ncbi:hypothetical protein [Luteirhabdus pelagi]|uniref:hypothetical protein n=1 Tax=Luteirhabdus pelagi TaxID=2792783 RepID=UPI00193A5AAE|nr:hypothetical protein [Luteirhabdus pelagi]
MRKTTIFLSFLLLAVLHLSAQETVQQTDNTLEGQFTDVIDESNDYQEYKVIKKYKINELRKNILDTVSSLESKIESRQQEIDSQKNEINSLTEELQTTQEDLSLSREKENGIEILGVLTEKSTYNAIMWTIILILVLGIGFLAYKFKNSHKVTKAAQLKLAETEIEFETHRQKTLEREQKIRRKLQDEINKNRKA